MTTHLLLCLEGDGRQRQWNRSFGLVRYWSVMTTRVITLQRFSLAVLTWRERDRPFLDYQQH